MGRENHLAVVLTNIPYILLGLIIFETTSMVWGLGVVLMGAGSYYSHLVKGRWLFDWIGMFIAYSMQIAYSLFVFVDLYSLYVVFGMLALVLSVGYPENKGRIILKFPFGFEYKTNQNRLYLGILYVLSAILAFLIVPSAYAIISFGLYALALAIRSKNHSLWHILTCLGIASILLGRLM